MSLKYANVALTPLTPDLAVVADRWWRREAPDLWAHPGYLVGKAHHLPIPAPPPIEAARFNTLYWPVGASRWACMHTFVGGEQAETIHTAAGLSSSPSPQTLLLSDTVNDTSIEPQMWLLGARPMFVASDDSNKRLWWLTLVDDRYWWWTRDTNYDFDDGDSWSQLLTNLISAATNGAQTPTIPSISSEYGSPNYQRWKLTGVPLPLIIDAAAAALGLRLVRRLDGTIRFVTAADALTLDESQYNTYVAAGHRVFGGRNTPADVIGNIPASVVVAAPDGTVLDTVTLAELAITEYGSLTGVPGAKAWVGGDREETSTGYVTAQARAYYLWALSPTDATFRSIQEWIPTGLEDRIEWEYMPGREAAYRSVVKNSLDVQLPWERVLTRVVRRPWADRNVYLADNTATPGPSGDNTFLALLTAKCYYDGSGGREGDDFTPTGNGVLTCEVDLACLTRSIQYSWIKVVEVEDDTCPQDYEFSPDGLQGGPQCNPLYHVRDLDYPVYPGPSPASAFAGAAANNDAAGTVPWTNPSNATGEGDDSYATATLLATEDTNYLELTGFCFGLGGTASITNIAVTVHHKASGEGVKDTEVRLLTAGGTVGNNMSVGAAVPSIEGTQEFSHSPAAWGHAFTAAEINNAGFGVAIRYINDDDDTRIVSVDAVRIAISFTPAGSTIPRLAVVRVWRHSSGVYFFDAHPNVAIVRRTAVDDDDGIIAFRRYYDQNADDWRDGTEVRVVLSE